MKVNQSLTAAITAAALVVGAGFAYAQSTAPQVTNTQGGSSAQGPILGNQGTTTPSGTMNSNTTMQAQPSTSTGTSVDNSGTTMQRDMVTPEPRADRN